MGGTKGGLMGAGGAGKSTTDERGLTAGTFFAIGTAFCEISSLTGGAATGFCKGETLLGAAVGLESGTFSTDFTGAMIFLADLSEAAFLSDGAFFAGVATEVGTGFFAGAAFSTGAGFLTGADFLTGAGFLPVFTTGFFAAGAGFLTGVAFFPAFTAGFLAAGAGFEDFAAGLAPPLEGADFVLIFFAAMETG